MYQLIKEYLNLARSDFDACESVCVDFVFRCEPSFQFLMPLTLHMPQLQQATGHKHKHKLVSTLSFWEVQ